MDTVASVSGVPSARNTVPRTAEVVRDWAARLPLVGQEPAAAKSPQVKRSETRIRAILPEGGRVWGFLGVGGGHWARTHHGPLRRPRGAQVLSSWLAKQS